MSCEKWLVNVAMVRNELNATYPQQPVAHFAIAGYLRKMQDFPNASATPRQLVMMNVTLQYHGYESEITNEVLPKFSRDVEK